ncbi:hypothetical protein AB6A23_03210 [Paenibacillus tarimensis]
MKLGKAELIFLEEVWGPAFNYDYNGLKAEYPFRDLKGGQRFADFVYVRNGVRLMIEIDGYTTHARDISPGDFNDHLTRQNDMVLSGWLLLRFSAWQVEKRPQICQRQLKQAIGHWWSLTYGKLSSAEMDLWEMRKQLIIQLAIRKGGKVKPVDLADEFNISNRTAIDWLQKLEKEGLVDGYSPNQRVVYYRLITNK